MEQNTADPLLASFIVIGIFLAVILSGALVGYLHNRKENK